MQTAQIFLSLRRQKLERNMATAPAYPYQNVDLSDIEGEQWEDIPGLDGYYRVSNFGRIKRLAFEILCSNGQLRRIKERMLAPEVAVQHNHSVHDENYFLRIKIMKEGKVYQFSVARLVYYAFVKPFDLSNLKLVVIAKDGNGKNIEPGNLKLVDLSHKQQRIFERDRLYRHIPDALEEFINQGLDTSTNPACKQVSQYTLEGKKLQTFPGTKVAAQVLGISEAGINSVLKGRQVSSGGFVWRYGKEEQVDMETEREERRLHHKHLVGQKVSQYNSEGYRIATFLTISDAAKAVGLGSGDISAALSGRQKSAGGFIWKRGWGKPQLDLSHYAFGETLRAQKKRKPVKQYTSDGRYLQTYTSVKEAAAALSIRAASISSVLNKTRLVKGFRWKTANP